MTSRSSKPHPFKLRQRVSPEEARAFVLSTIALSSGVFGIAFWYGVFGVVFFEQLFYVWVASTVALLASQFVPPVDALPAFMSWRGRFVLILPTVWLVWSAIGGAEAMDGAHAGWVEWLLVAAIVALTLPYLLYVLIMVAVPDLDRLTNPSLRAATLLITLTIAATGYAIGHNHPRFLSCNDFDVSGSSVPKNCRRSTHTQFLSLI